MKAAFKKYNLDDLCWTYHKFCSREPDFLGLYDKPSNEKFTKTELVDSQKKQFYLLFNPEEVLKNFGTETPTDKQNGK